MFDKKQISRQSSEVVDLLKTISNELKHIHQPAISKLKDPFVIKAAIILAISTGLAINGGSQLVRIMWTKTPFTIDTHQLLIDSMYWGGGIIISLLVIAMVFLGRSARTHLVMIELILIGTFGSVATVFSEMRDINIELDKSDATTHEVKTLDKRYNRSRRSTSYYLYLDDWNNEEARKKIEVSSAFYQSVLVGDEIVVKQKPGYLKYRWVESIEKKIGY